MASVNKVIIVGAVGRDPELRYLPSGEAVANISIATSTRHTNKQTGEKIETTEWHRITFFGKLAEIVGEYVKKGKPLYVEGRLKYGKFTNKDGHEQNTCDIIATEMQLLGGRDSESAPSAAPAQNNASQSRPAAPNPPISNGFEDMSDDIPYANTLRGAARCLAL
jgi:single-strand DNA-binding protein